MTRINYIALFQESPLRTEKTLSLVELIRGGGLGGQIIIGLLFLLLLVAIYIYFERWFAIRAASKIDKNFMEQIKTYVKNVEDKIFNKHCYLFIGSFIFGYF